MKLNTYDHTPRPEKVKPISVWVIIAAAFLYGIVGLLAFVYFRGSQWFLSIVIILAAILATAMVLAAKKDIEESYVEILGDNIHIVDYPLGIKKKKRIAFSDITSAEPLCRRYCAEGVCNSGTAESSNVAQGKSLLFPAERTLSPTATTAPLPSRQA